MKKLNFLFSTLIIAILLFLPFIMFGQTWATKVATAADDGAASIRTLMDPIIRIVMAIAGISFIMGIASAGFKYKNGDQYAFKHLGGVFYGSLIILVGAGLAQVLFF